MKEFCIDRRQMKLDARDVMRTHRPSVYLVAFVFIAITFLLETLSTKLNFPGVSMQELMQWSYNEKTAAAVMQASRNAGSASKLLNFVITVMSAMISGGFALFCLNVSRRQEATVGTLFDMFNWFFRYLWLTILMGIFIFLWSLLLVIPGIIAVYRYSMAPYIFFDDPDKSALQCIRESKEMTQGHKGELFVLDLSFIGWSILCVIPLVSIFVTPYYNITKANFYNALSGDASDAPRQEADPWEM